MLRGFPKTAHHGIVNIKRRGNRPPEGRDLIKNGFLAILVIYLELDRGLRNDTGLKSRSRSRTLMRVSQCNDRNMPGLGRGHKTSCLSGFAYLLIIYRFLL